MAISGLTVLLVAIDLALFVVAVRRPALALILLLAGIPFTGLLLDVIAHPIGTDSSERLALAAWHDALVGGIVIAAVLALRRVPRPHLRSLETLIAAVLVFGLVGVARAPNLVPALYSYRTLYEPVALMGAILILYRAGTLSPRIPGSAAAVIVGAGVASAIFAFWQVYVGGFGFLNLYYRISNGVLPAAYQSAFVTQPRAIGTFHSPNEFGAFLVLAVILAVTPGILGQVRFRSWLAVLLGLALVLTFSRSAWVGAVAALAVLGAMLLRPERPRIHIGFGRLVTTYLAPASAFLVISVAILASSGGLRFVEASLGGVEPSAMTHVGAVQDAITGVLNGPPATDRPSGTVGPGQTAEPSQATTRTAKVTAVLLGGGLGTAGPKSTRFTGAEPARHSEIWYLDFVWQVGLAGLAMAGLLVGATMLRLVQARRPRPWPAAGLAGIVALGAGAVFIPVLEEPSVSVTLWVLLGLAVAIARKQATDPLTPRAA